MVCPSAARTFLRSGSPPSESPFSASPAGSPSPAPGTDRVAPSPLPLKPRSTARRRGRPGTSPPTAGSIRESCADLGIPDLTDPDWKTATDPAQPVTGMRRPGAYLPVRPGRPRRQAAAAGGRRHPGRPADGSRRRPRLPAVERPDEPADHLRSRDPPGTRAQGHHRHPPGGPRHHPLLGRRPRRLLGPGLRSRGRPGPLRQHETGHLPGLLEDRQHGGDLTPACHP